MLDNIDKHTDQVSSFRPTAIQTTAAQCVVGVSKRFLGALQVRNDLFFNLMSSLAGSADPGVLEAMVALADVSSSSGMEQWVAQCANKYL